MITPAVKKFFDLAEQRRSVYTIDDKDPVLSSKEVELIVKEALETCPSPWNIKSSCCLILTGQHHKTLFNNIVLPTFERDLPEEAFRSMEGKIKGLAAGYGTVIFFENQDIWDQLVEDSPRSKPMVEPWGNVVSGMLQYTVWTALAVAGLGCSLQHYDSNPDIVRQIDSQFDVPHGWRLKAELVFGHKTQEPGNIPHKPLATIEQRYKVLS